jgi:hypothetical protein
MGKPTADIYVDDKAINSADWENNGHEINIVARRS